MTNSLSLTVLSIKQETDDTFTFFLKQPVFKKVKYQAGQYLTLIFRINGRRYLRPYSFSSAPDIDPSINITIKRMSGGVVSNHVIDNVMVGNQIEVLPPMGKFTLPPNDLSKRNLYFWCCGSGITPIFSIIKFVLANNLASNITLIYGNKNRSTTIFAQEIDSLQQKFPSKLTIWHFLSSATLETSSPFIIQGRVVPQKIFAELNKETDLTNSLHYICGPFGLKQTVKNVLSSLNIVSTNIFSEDFEVSRNEKELNGIITRDVIFEQNNISTLVEVSKGKSILEAGIDSMLELDYSCQTGECNLCLVTLAEGSVRHIGLKENHEIRPDQALMCCSFPLSDNIKLII